MKRFTLLLTVAIASVLAFAQAPQSKKAAPAAVNKTTMVAQREAKAKVSPAKATSRMAVAAQKKQSDKTALKVKASANAAKMQTKAAKADNRQFAKSLKAQRKTAGVQQKKVVARDGKAQKQTTAVKKNANKVEASEPTAAPADLETETYVFTGASYYDMGNTTFNVQVGFDGNDVYVQGLLRSLPDGWIKGVKEGNTITFPKGQYLGEAEIFDYETQESLGMYPAWLSYEDGMTGEITDVVLSINPENGVIDDMNEGALCFNTLNDEYLDVLMSTRLTPMSQLGDISYDIVLPSANAEQWAVDISYFSLSFEGQQSSTGIMAIDGNDIYVMGLCPDLSNAWVKGTLDADGNVTFAKGQYLGQYYGMFDMWFMGINPENEAAGLCDVVAKWDATEKSLVFDETSWIVENADPISMYYADVLYDVSVYPMGDDRSLVIPPAGLETKTYATKVASLGGYAYANATYNVNIGFDGDDAYMQGLLYFAPSAWIKGTRNADGSITFVKNQYIGTVQGYDIYVVPCDDEENVLDDFTFVYDEENDTYTYITQNTNISFSVAPETTDAVEIIFNVVMAGPDAPQKPEIDTNVIWDQPEGEMQMYTREGGAYYSFWGYIIDTTQSGTSIKVVTAPDGKTVYMENPISQGQIEGGTWVKGTLEGNKIHMPLRQCVLYSDEDGYGYMTATFNFVQEYDEDYEEYYYNYEMSDDDEIVFVINADGTIAMEEKAVVDEETGFANKIYGLAYTDDFSWTQLGDYNSVYTPFNEEFAVMPEGVEKETWAFMYNDGNYDNARMVNAAIVGDKMYIEGLSEYDPEAVMVGTIADGKVTFTSDQYLGANSGYIAYGTFANCSVEILYDEVYDEEYEMMDYEFIPEYSFNYDAVNKILTSQSDVAFILNAGKGETEILYIECAYAPKFCYFEEVAAVPADPEFNGVDSWFDDYGYDIASVNIKLEDLNGKYIDKEQVFYQLYVKIDGESEPFVFYADEYAGFAELDIEEMTEVPYSFTVLDDFGYEDIAEAGSNICIYQSGFDDYGIQTIYYGGGERNTSNIVWLNAGVEEGTSTSISNVASETKTSAIYDVYGRKMQKLQRGLNIVMNKNGKAIKVRF